MFGNARGGGSATIALCLAALTSACLDRPLCEGESCSPRTTNQFTARVYTGGVDKIDLVFMIDNSASMADKQELLRSAVPPLLSRFIDPLCVDDDKKPNGSVSVGGFCSNGHPEFSPIRDIHIAVISSSLAVPGGGTCDSAMDPDDKAWLLPKARPALGLASWANSGFLAWDPSGQRNSPPGTAQPNELKEQFQDLVSAVAEHGCGFEASLESWYRFLISPDPPVSTSVGSNYITTPVGVDHELIAQRDAFLRSDSLVAIVMLTDENDCSIRWDAQGAMVGSAPRNGLAVSACQDPNDRCCRPCDKNEVVPTGCLASAQDPACQMQPSDDTNQRCFHERQRFGWDMLEPVEKYIRGLTQTQVPDRNGVLQPNPLFMPRNGRGARSPNLVFLAGILGVPWQDLASDDSQTGTGLRYLTARELREQKRWDVILGDPSKNQPPSDPHMIESDLPRSGAHPFVANATIAAADSNSPHADVISGHEQLIPAHDDLQFACIFELTTPRSCDRDTTCDCASPFPDDKQSPLCQPPAGGVGGTTQYYAKAYPGLRELEVLKGIGDQGIVASICAKVTHSAEPEADANYGYNPAMDALVSRISDVFASQCLTRAPEVDAQGHAACEVLETKLDGSCDCSLPGRSAASESALASVRRDLANSGVCDGPGESACSKVCACELHEARDAALAACRTTKDPSQQAPAYCYIDPERNLGDPALVKDCPSTRRKLLRIVGDRTPLPDSVTYMACFGENVQGTLGN